jgi:hypothetical protein
LCSDFNYRGAARANVDARDFLAFDALKLVQPVDVVFRLE